jgi:hypothetical protein
MPQEKTQCNQIEDNFFHAQRKKGEIFSISQSKTSSSNHRRETER